MPLRSVERRSYAWPLECSADSTQQLDRRIATAVEQRERQSRQADSKRDAIRQRMARLQETHDELMAERAGIEEKAAIRHRAIAAKEREVRRTPSQAR